MLSHANTSIYERVSTSKHFPDMCERVEKRYIFHEKIHKGTSGMIYKATDKITGNEVAVKKIFEWHKNSGDTERLYREIRLLEFFKGHPNIIKLINIIKSKYDVYLIFEYMQANLADVIHSLRIPFKQTILTLRHIKFITYQLLKALKYIHTGGIIIRELRPDHVLVSPDCTAKLIDFALAKSLSDNDKYNYQLNDFLSCRFYRAPELLIGMENYDYKVDVWSLGCILAEMITGKTMFKGEDIPHTLNLILQYTGIPSEDEMSKIYESVASFLRSIVAKGQQVSYQDYFTKAISLDEPEIDLAIDLVKQMLMFNQTNRISVEKALDHEFFCDIRKTQEEIECDVLFDFKLNDALIKEINEYKDSKSKFKK